MSEITIIPVGNALIIVLCVSLLTLLLVAMFYYIRKANGKTLWLKIYKLSDNTYFLRYGWAELGWIQRANFKTAEALTVYINELVQNTNWER